MVAVGYKNQRLRSAHLSNPPPQRDVVGGWGGGAEMAQQDFPCCKFRSFPLVTLVWGGGGGLLRWCAAILILPYPPPPPCAGHRVDGPLDNRLLPHSRVPRGCASARRLKGGADRNLVPGAT